MEIGDDVRRIPHRRTVLDHARKPKEERGKILTGEKGDFSG